MTNHTHDSLRRAAQAEPATAKPEPREPLAVGDLVRVTKALTPEDGAWAFPPVGTQGLLYRIDDDEPRYKLCNVGFAAEVEVVKSGGGDWASRVGAPNGLTSRSLDRGTQPRPSQDRWVWTNAPTRDECIEAIAENRRQNIELRQALARHAPNGVEVLEQAPIWWDAHVAGAFVRGAMWGSIEWGIEVDGSVWGIDTDEYRDNRGLPDDEHELSVAPLEVPPWLITMLTGHQVEAGEVADPEAYEEAKAEGRIAKLPPDPGSDNGHRTYAREAKEASSEPVHRPWCCDPGCTAKPDLLVTYPGGREGSDYHACREHLGQLMGPVTGDPDPTHYTVTVLPKPTETS